jgi:hypothetical protein
VVEIAHNLRWSTARKWRAHHGRADRSYAVPEPIGVRRIDNEGTKTLTSVAHLAFAIEARVPAAAKVPAPPAVGVVRERIRARRVAAAVGHGWRRDDDITRRAILAGDASMSAVWVRRPAIGRRHVHDAGVAATLRVGHRARFGWALPRRDLLAYVIDATIPPPGGDAALVLRALEVRLAARSRGRGAACR